MVFSTALLIVAQLALLLSVVWLVWRLRRGRRAQGAMPMEDGAVAVPVKAVFIGLKALPWVAVATNSLNPALHIGAESIAWRVLGWRRRPLADVEQVDLRSLLLTVNLVFRFRGEMLDVAANVGSLANAREALRLLPASVALTERARAVRDAPAG